MIKTLTIYNRQDKVLQLQRLMVKSPMSRLVLIDAHSVLYRSFFAFIRNPLRNSKGMNTSAIFGFANTLKKVLRNLKPAFCAVVFDAPGKTFRDEIYVDYKAQRPKMPPELNQSIGYAKMIVTAWSLKVLEITGIEADDVIGALAQQGKEAGLEVIIVSGDKDLLQLVGENVKVFDPYQEKYYDPSVVKEKFGIAPEQVADFLALAGDPADNIPGVPGIGPKKAKALLIKYGTLEQVLANEENLKIYRDIAILSRDLAVIKPRAEAIVAIEFLKLTDPDTVKLTEIYRELEFTSFLKELQPSVVISGSNNHWQIKDFNAELARKITDGGVIGFAFAPEKGFWIAGEENIIMFLPLKEQQTIAKVCSDQELIKVGFNIKEEMKQLLNAGFTLHEPFFDNCIAAWLVDPNRKRYNTEDVVAQVLKETLTEIKNGEAAGWAVRVYHSLLPEVSALGLKTVYDELEMPLIAVLVRMEERGIKIDVGFFGQLLNELENEKHQLTQKIWNLAGVQFNIGSPKQLATVLYERLKLPRGRRTKTGYSTGSDVLLDLVNAHPIIPEVLRYRELDKLCNTYLAPLPAMVNPKTQRLHTSFNQWGTSTGRLSSIQPNLQNIPIRGEIGRKIRKGFVAGDRMMLISADYSQIELRVLAHFSEDERLIEAFNRGEDIHTATAATILGIAPEDVTPEQRRIAKMVNYGIIYGMGDWGLSTRMDIPIEQARAFMEKYFVQFPGVADWRERLTEQVRKDGFVRTISGRIRPVPGIASENRPEADAALRAALNAPMQGSAADIIKRAMIIVDQRLHDAKVEGGIILQIHDELLIEVEEGCCDKVKEMVKDEMERSWQLHVPLVVDIGAGTNWGESL